MGDDQNRRAPGTGRIKIAGRLNKAIATNIGGTGSTHGVSSSQKVRIRQDRTGTYEDVETSRIEHTGREDQ